VKKGDRVPLEDAADAISFQPSSESVVPSFYPQFSVAVGQVEEIVHSICYSELTNVQQVWKEDRKPQPKCYPFCRFRKNFGKTNTSSTNCFNFSLKAFRAPVPRSYGPAKLAGSNLTLPGRGNNDSHKARWRPSSKPKFILGNTLLEKQLKEELAESLKVKRPCNQARISLIVLGKFSLGRHSPRPLSFGFDCDAYDPLRFDKSRRNYNGDSEWVVKISAINIL
jgi:hypothetical protein